MNLTPRWWHRWLQRHRWPHWLAPPGWHHVDHPYRITAEILGAFAGFAVFVVGLTYAFSGFGNGLAINGDDQIQYLQFGSVSGDVKVFARPIGVGPGHPLDPPAKPLQVGWWGVPPGETQGTTLFTWRASHQSFPAGTMNNLEDVERGAQVTVNSIAYTVSEVSVEDTEVLTDQAQDTLSGFSEPRLVMVAFEGWADDCRCYGRVVVVTAIPVNPPTPTPEPPNPAAG